MKLEVDKKIEHKTTKIRGAITTLRGVRRLANREPKESLGPFKVRQRNGHMVSARAHHGEVEIHYGGSEWVKYPKHGRNLDPLFRPGDPRQRNRVR